MYEYVLKLTKLPINAKKKKNCQIKGSRLKYLLYTNLYDEIRALVIWLF